MGERAMQMTARHGNGDPRASDAAVGRGRPARPDRRAGLPRPTAASLARGSPLPCRAVICIARSPMKRPSKCSLCSGVRLEAFELADSPIYAHGSCYVTNRVGIGARGLRPGPDAALLSVTGRSPVPRVSPTPPAIFRNTNHARIPEESGPTPPTATGVTTSVGGSPVEFAGRRYRGQVALDRFGRGPVDSRQLLSL